MAGRSLTRSRTGGNSGRSLGAVLFWELGPSLCWSTRKLTHLSFPPHPRASPASWCNSVVSRVSWASLNGRILGKEFGSRPPAHVILAPLCFFLAAALAPASHRPHANSMTGPLPYRKDVRRAGQAEWARGARRPAGGLADVHGARDSAGHRELSIGRRAAQADEWSRQSAARLQPLGGETCVNVRPARPFRGEMLARVHSSRRSAGFALLAGLPLPA